MGPKPRNSSTSSSSVSAPVSEPPVGSIGLGRIDYVGPAPGDPAPVAPAGARMVVTQKLDNVFNKMLLLTSNLFPDDFIPTLPAILANATDGQSINSIREHIDNIVGTHIGNIVRTQQQHITNLINAYKQRLNSSSIFSSSDAAKTACVNYDLLSLNGVVQGNDDEKIGQIALLFYKYVLEVHLYSLYSISKELSISPDTAAGSLQGHNGGVLFENPIFTGYGGAFVAADGIHDAEPRGDMTVGEIVPKRGNKPAKGGWTFIKNAIGQDSRDKLIEAIRNSSTKPTEAQSDDITNSIKWDSLNKTTGHHLLDPVECSTRLVCNIELQELIKLASSQFLNSSNRFKIVKVNEPNVTDKDSANVVKKTTEIVRRVYGIGSLNNNYAVSDCSGPTPEELHEIVASSNTTQVLDNLENNDDDDDDDDDEEDDSGAGKKKSKSKSKKGPRGNVTAFLSHLLDSSKGNSAGGINKLRQIPSLRELNGIVTFLLPHTRWTFEIKKGTKPAKNAVAGQILHIFQRAIIDFRGNMPQYKIRFEAWRTDSNNPTQAYPSVFVSKSDFFVLTESDKCPGVNETIRYIFSTDFVDTNSTSVLGSKTSTIKKSIPIDLAERYVEKMFPEPKSKEPNMTKARLSRKFFDKFLNACNTLLANMPTALKQAMGNVPLFKMAYLFRQKTMGDYLRLADTAYLNEILWVSENKLGIGVEGTCDGYSGIKAMASNNCPVILCEAKEWGKNFTMYSSFTLNPEDAERAAELERKTIYIEKTRKTLIKLEQLQTEFYRIKQLGIDDTLKRIYDNMRVVFFQQGLEFLEKVVVDKLLSLNNNIIRYTLVLNDALASDSTLQIKKANYEINDSKYSINLISDSVESTLGILGLFLLMNTFVTNWLSYCEQYIEQYYKTIKGFNDVIDNTEIGDLTPEVVDRNTPIVNKCISLAPSTDELDKILLFLESGNKVVPNWSKTDASIQEFTSELLTVNLNKKEPKLKKLVDRGIPDFLSQEKNTTVNYVSLVNYKQVVSALKEMFTALQIVNRNILLPPDQSDIPQINSMFSTGILNVAAKEHFCYWFELVPVATPIVVVGVPVAVAEEVPVTDKMLTDAKIESDRAEEEANQAEKERKEGETANEAEKKRLEEAFKEAEVEAMNKRSNFAKLKVKQVEQKEKTPRIKKFLSAVKSVMSGNYFLRSLKTMRRDLRSSRVVPSQGGGQRGGTLDFNNLTSRLITSAKAVMEGELDFVKSEEYYYRNIGDYLPVLDGKNFYQGLDEPEAEADDTADEEAEEILKGLQEDIPQEDESNFPGRIFVNDSLNGVVSSNLGDVEYSFNELIISSNFKKGEEASSLADVMNGVNENLLSSTISDMITFLEEELELRENGSEAYVNIHVILSFLESYQEQPQPNDVDAVNNRNNRNGFFNLVSIFLKFMGKSGVQISNGISLRLMANFVLFEAKENEENKEEYTYKEIFIRKLQFLFQKLIDTSTVFNPIFNVIIPDLFFKVTKEEKEEYFFLRKRVIYFVVRDNYGVELDDANLARYINEYQLLTMCALLYNDSLLINAVSELYFKTSGTAQLVLPPMIPSQPPRYPNQAEIEYFYTGKNGYYTQLHLNYRQYPIPLESSCLPFLLLSKCKDGESTPLIKDANKGITDTTLTKCKELIIKPLIDYFWDDYCSYALQSGIKDAVKYRLMFQNKNGTDEQVKDLLTDYLYCYLFDTCKIAKNHNGIIMDNVPGAIIELNLVQYTTMASRAAAVSEPESAPAPATILGSTARGFGAAASSIGSLASGLFARPKPADAAPPQVLESAVENTSASSNNRTYLSYSAAELQEMVGKFMNLPGGSGERTPAEWNAWANPLSPGAVKLEGRPETTQELMQMFTGDVLQGVVSNYSYFSKRQKKELGIDNLVDINGNELVKLQDSASKTQVTEILGAKPRTLMELFNIVLFRVAFVNIENVNVAMISLLSEKLGSYLINPEELFVDINSGIELDDPDVKLYNFFVSLFFPPNPEQLELEKMNSSREMLVKIIEKNKSDPELKKYLKRIVSSNPKLVGIILSIIKSEKPGTDSYFYKILKSAARTVDTIKELEADKKIKERYYDFLNSLLPKSALPMVVSPAVSAEVVEPGKKVKKGGSKTHKNLPKKKNRSFSRRL